MMLATGRREGKRTGRILLLNLKTKHSSERICVNLVRYIGAGSTTRSHIVEQLILIYRPTRVLCKGENKTIGKSLFFFLMMNWSKYFGSGSYSALTVGSPKSKITQTWGIKMLIKLVLKYQMKMMTVILKCW